MTKFSAQKCPDQSTRQQGAKEPFPHSVLLGIAVFAIDAALRGIVAFSFGLLHGLGFAGALSSEVDLPGNDIVYLLAWS